MKTIRVSDETHKKLTEILGKLTAETGKIHTYEDAINALIKVFNYDQNKNQS
ncbi:MAG: hypothetical protein QXF61_04080 [Nitrososphaeria archaeon]